MANLVKEISGDVQVQKVIAAAGAVPRERGLWQAIGDEVKGQVEERFDTSTAPDGSKWPVSWRVKLGLGGGPTLVDRGDMRRAITINVTDESGELVVPKAYAATHQFGATIKPVNAKALQFKLGMRGNAPKFVFTLKSKIPPRPFLGFNAENITGITAAIAEYMRLRTAAPGGATP